ncbi:DUF5326 family protein [Kitasatospora sp. NPDC051170]|uniref:DUF5326 family protein n=1 Tax=Kitasatospora sp. NPDC051170 TaxID=3364056 RepID=UPI00378E189A
MAELWKSLPSWVRNIVIPVLVLVLAWNIIGFVGAVLSIIIKLLVVVGIAAAVVILVKKAARS